MKFHHSALFLLVLVISMFISSHGDPIPKKGKGRKAFGGGLLTGVLAGAVVSNVLTRRAQASNTESVKHVTTIQNGPLLPNGCFEQTVRESDKGNSRKIVETVNLVCPPGVPVSVVTPMSAIPMNVLTPAAVPHTPISISTPIQQATQITPAVQMAEHVTPQLPTIATQSNPESVQHGFINPPPQQVHQPTTQIPQVGIVNLTSTISQHIPQTQPQMVPEPASPSVLIPEQATTQIPAVATQPNPGPVHLGFINPATQHVHQATIQTQMQPQAAIQLTPQISSTSQQIPQVTTQTTFPQAPNVYVISKRTEYHKKKSAAISLVLGNKFLIYSSIILLILFM